MSIDLTTGFPRSPREALDGIMILPRAIDKARAQLAGTIGDYKYFDCGINRVLFDMLDVSDEQFLDAVKNTTDDAGVLAWIHDEIEPEPAAIEKMNTKISMLEPAPEQKAYFDSELQAFDPGNTSVTRWIDLLDLQEGRIAKHSAEKIHELNDM